MFPGLCLRLWTRHDDRSLADYETPEIRRVDLAAPVLSSPRLAIEALRDAFV